MAQSPLDRQKLIQGLEEDLAQGESKYASAEKGTGVYTPADSQKSFRPKAIRIKGKTIAQKELKEAQKAMDDAINHLTENQHFKNESERRAFRHELGKKMNQFQLEMLKSGARMEFELKKRGLEQAEQDAMIGMFGDAVSGAAMAAIGFSKGKKSPELGKDPSQSQLGGSYSAPVSQPNDIFAPGSTQTMTASGYGNMPKPMPSPTPQIIDPTKARGVQDSFKGSTQEGIGTKFKRLFQG